MSPSKNKSHCPYQLGRVNFCQKHPNMPAESFYCVFWCTDQPQKNQHDSSTSSWSKFAIKFTMRIKIGIENILGKKPFLMMMLQI